MSNIIIDVLTIILLWIKEILVYLFVPKSFRIKSIKDELVLVTGGGSGIGRLMAIMLSEKGANVIIWDVNEEGMKQTKKLIERNGGKCWTFRCDVSKREEVYAVASTVKSDVGKVTILINNAGIVCGKSFEELPDESIIKTMNVNAMAHFWTLKAFLPDMKRDNHGHLVYVSSYAGLVGADKLSDYCASKFANIGLAESIALELETDGYNKIHTTIVCPFLINTGLFDGCHNSFVPTLDPTETAKRIVDAILTNQQMLVMPRLLYITNYLKSILPVVCQIRLFHAIEGHKFMDSFKGRQVTNGDANANLD